MDRKIEKEWDSEYRKGELWGYWVEFVRGKNAETILSSILNHDVCRILRKHIPSEGKILEAGCGSGRHSCALSNRARRVIALDYSINALKLAGFISRKTGREINRIRADIFNLPFSDNSFNFVFNEGVIEHFTKKKRQKAVKEMARVLDKGGKTVLFVPPRNIFYRYWQVTKYPGFRVPEKPLSLRELCGHLSKENIQVTGYGGTETETILFYWHPIFGSRLRIFSLPIRFLKNRSEKIWQILDKIGGYLGREIYVAGRKVV